MQRPIRNPKTTLHPSVFERFELPAVIQYDSAAPYRPEALRSRRCHHAAVLVARSYADDVPVSAFSPRMVGDGLLIEVFPALGRIG